MVKIGYNSQRKSKMIFKLMIPERGIDDER